VTSTAVNYTGGTTARGGSLFIDQTVLPKHTLDYGFFPSSGGSTVERVRIGECLLDAKGDDRVDPGRASSGNDVGEKCGTGKCRQADGQ
jgi:hypothetical protein